jgi:hypothetical protein
MPRKNHKERERERGRKTKVKPNIKVQVYIPSKPYRTTGDISPGWVVAEGRVRIG